MSGRRSVKNEGTNSRGNWYRAYDDGAYRYKNTDGARYFNDGRDHGFYKLVSGVKLLSVIEHKWTPFRSSRDGTKDSGGQPFSRYYDYKSGSSRTYSGHKSQSATTSHDTRRQTRGVDGYDSSNLSYQLGGLSLGSGSRGQSSGQRQTVCHTGYLELVKVKSEDTSSDRGGAHYEGHSHGESGGRQGDGYSYGGGGGAEGGYDHDDEYDADYVGYADYDDGYERYDDDDYDY